MGNTFSFRSTSYNLHGNYILEMPKPKNTTFGHLYLSGNKTMEFSTQFYSGYVHVTSQSSKSTSAKPFQETC